MQDSANLSWDASDSRHHKIQAQAQLVSFIPQHCVPDLRVLLSITFVFVNKVASV
jgi:hypothetical protein